MLDLPTILLVEAGPQSQGLYRTYLESSSLRQYVIWEAHTLQSALRFLNTKSPDLLILDLHLVDGSGLTLVHYLRDQYSPGPLPVIMVMGESEQRAAVRALKLGVWAVLTAEDLVPAQLGEIVDQTLQALASQSQAISAQNFQNNRTIQQSILDNAPLAIIATDTNGIIHIFNHQAESMFGYRAEEVIGKMTPALFHEPEELQERIGKYICALEPHILPDFEAFLSFASQDVIKEQEWTHRRRDGSIFPVSLSVTPLRDEDNKLIGFVGITQDLSEQHQRKKQLQDLSERLSIALKSGAIGTWEWNLVENLSHWDERMYELHGVNPPLNAGHDCEIIEKSVHPDDFPRIQELINQSLQGQAEYDTDFRVVHPNQSIYHIKAYAQVLRNEQGQPLRMVGVNYDITTQKLTEQALQTSEEKLRHLLQLREEALTLREDMSNMLVHDLRNPLCSILTAADLIKQYTYDPKSFSQSLILDKASQIIRLGHRLKNMIDSLLVIAKLESGKFIFSPTLTDLFELGQAAIADFAPSAHSNNIEFTYQLPEPGHLVLVDGSILQRVIDNLLSNALRFTPTAGQVNLTIQSLENGSIQVIVTDTGSGIDEEQKNKIFEKFEIGTAKKNVAQLGLGLAFCKMVVESQGGNLILKDNHPHGSIFMVTI